MDADISTSLVSTDKAIDSNSPCTHKNGNNVLNHLDKEQEEISSLTILQQKLKRKEGKEKELRSDFEKFQKQHVNKLPKNIIAEINVIENQCSKKYGEIAKLRSTLLKLKYEVKKREEKINPDRYTIGYEELTLKSEKNKRQLEKQTDEIARLKEVLHQHAKESANLKRVIDEATNKEAFNKEIQLNKLNERVKKLEKKRDGISQKLKTRKDKFERNSVHMSSIKIVSRGYNESIAEKSTLLVEIGKLKERYDSLTLNDRQL